MLRPDLFGGFALHAGDALYEYHFLPEFAQVVRALREYDGDLQAWWSDFSGRTAFSKPNDGMLLSALGCSAAFSADADGTRSTPATATSTSSTWARRPSSTRSRRSA